MSTSPVETETGARSGEALFAELCEQVRAGMWKHHVPGVALAVFFEGQEHTAALGVTSVDNPLQVTADTLFQVGSITKTVTATAIMRLVEMGKIDLHAPVRNYLPELTLHDESVAAQVTIWHLLTHTSGWLGDYFDDLGWGDDALASIVAKMATLPQWSGLGELWSYNNAGFYVAGRVLEKLLGKPYETLARELVLDPLGMRTSFFFAHEAITYRVAIGHNNPYREGAYPPITARPWPLPRTSAPIGGLISTVKDLLKYARFHLGDGTAPDGTRLLTPESLALMRTPQVEGADDNLFGLSWFIRDVDGTRLVRHGGRTNGQVAQFALVPKREFALILLTNADLGGEITLAATNWALEHYLGAREAEPQPLETTEEGLRPYEGLYTGAMDDVELQVHDGALYIRVIDKVALPGAEMLEPNPPARAAFYKEDRLVILDEPGKGTRAEFLRGQDGEIAWLRIAGRAYARQKGFGQD